MGENKLSKKQTANMLSKAVSIEEIVIDTVSEMLGIDSIVVGEKFSESECCRELFDFSTEYYKNPIDKIVADFIAEFNN